MVQKRSTVQGNHYICKEAIASMEKSHPILIKNKEDDEPNGSKELRNVRPICPNNTLPKADHA